MTLSPDALNPSPISSSSLSLPDDRTKWLTHVTSPIDLDEPLTTRWSACTNCFTSLRLLVIGVQGMVSLNRSSYFCFAFKQQCHCNLKKGIISRQSSCLPLYSSSIKLVQSITWAYWLESSALERAVCKINALFSLRLAFLVLLFFASENERKPREKPFTSTAFTLFCWLLWLIWTNSALFPVISSAHIVLYPLSQSHTPAWIDLFTVVGGRYHSCLCYGSSVRLCVCLVIHPGECTV